MQRAFDEGDLDTVKILCEDADVNDFNVGLCLHKAFKKDRVNVVQFVVEYFHLSTKNIKDYIHKKYRNRELRTLFKHNSVNVFLYLCSRSVFTLKDIIRTLPYACYYADKNMVKTVCEKFKRINSSHIRYNKNWNLRWAAEGGKLETVVYLYVKYDLTRRDIRAKRLYTLRSAVKNGHLNVVIFLCKNLEFRHRDRPIILETFYYAACYGCIKQMEFLCDYFVYSGTNYNTHMNVYSEDVKNKTLPTIIAKGDITLLQYINNRYKIEICEFKIMKNIWLELALLSKQVKIVEFFKDNFDIKKFDILRVVNKHIINSIHVSVQQYLYNTFDILVTDYFQPQPNIYTPHSVSSEDIETLNNVEKIDDTLNTDFLNTNFDTDMFDSNFEYTDFEYTFFNSLDSMALEYESVL